MCVCAHFGAEKQEKNWNISHRVLWTVFVVSTPPIAITINRHRDTILILMIQFHIFHMSVLDSPPSFSHYHSS